MSTLNNGHEAQNGTPPRPISAARSPTQPRYPPDYNRPLPPPPPGSSVDNYDIPTLRRKPVPAENTSLSQAHTRSFSHPISSFFGSKKNDKKSAARQGSKDHNADEQKANPLASTTNNKAGKPEPVTGKCMTCDATVRWPQGLKVFRCTTCLTINDLEPFTEPMAQNSQDAPTRRPLPLSLDRTRSIIDHCLTRYLENQLRDSQTPITSSFAIAEPSAVVDSRRPEGLFTALFPDDDSPPTSPRPTLKTRSTSDPALTPIRPRRREGPPISRSAVHAEGDNVATQPRITPPPRNHEENPPSPVRQGPQPIFRSLENYIADSFTGCSTLNASFFTVKPQQEQRLHTSDRVPRRQQSEPVSPPALENDVFLSDLDAKTLLVGDFAENGSWWTGGRSWSPEKDGSRNRHGSPDRWKGIVSARSPRINWSDLAEWYRIVINAGEQWRRKWHELRNDVDQTKTDLSTAVSLEQLEREIADSQLHLHRSLLKSTENLLKRPRRPMRNPEDCRFLLMLLFNPLIYPSDAHSSASSTMASRMGEQQPARATPGVAQATPRRRAPGSNRTERNLGHHSGIIKRVLGLIANLPNDIHQFMVSWVSRFVDHHFQKTVELVGSFVTYRLSRQQQQRRVPEPNDPTAGLVPSFSNRETSHPSQLHAALDARSSTVSVQSSSGKPLLSTYGEDWQVRAACRVMALLFQANVGHPSRKRDLQMHTDQRLGNPVANARYHAQAHGQIVPVNIFYNSMLDYADLIADFEAWESTKTKFSFCQYPFFLSIYAKIHILEHDARRQMEVKAREAFFDSILSRKAISQYLVLKVRRDCLVEDSLRNVSEVVGSGGGDIKKGLRIDFVGEEGIDSGGLRKEWFLLLVREIFDPTHGLFVYDEDSQFCYFNPHCFESSEQFFLVGVLLGLAIYNSTILDVAFPPFVFKKMLASAPSTGDKLTSTPKIAHGYTLEDLAEFRPALAKGLRQLLEFEGDVQETFCRDFVIETERYGEKVEIPLCPGGDKRAVTNANRKEFVDMYIRYMLDTAVARQYEPFKRGFFIVCGGNALSLFRPEEIELLVRGSDEPLDIASLRAVAVYEGWPKASKDVPVPDRQPQVVWFWDFFTRISPTDQRKMLSFVTGSDRIPALGATNLIIKIGLLREKDDPMNETSWKEPERFPVARTCFNSIGLYQYRSRKKLEHKLWTAVTGSEGFGLK